MAKFNSPAQTIKTVNKEGHAAYSMKDRELLVSQVLTSFFSEPKFYGSNDVDLVKTAKVVAAKDPEFVAQLAYFARRVFNMRSVSHVLTAILAATPEGKKYVRQLIPAVTVRADDMTEILSAYLHFYGKPIPNSVKKGLNDAFGKFDEYSLAKYKGTQNKLKMRDVPRLCRPTPKDEAQADLWKRLIADELQTPFTWETELSAKGNTKAVWTELIESGKVGYMALLRNLRNIINADPDNIDKVYATLVDPEQVRKSKQLPFRFLSAYRELEKVGSVSSKVFDVLETALELSIDNMPKFPGRTAIAVDVSGSMTSAISAKSSVSCADIGLLLGVMSARLSEDSVFMTFDGSLYTPTVTSKGGLLAQVRGIRVNGGSTHMELPFGHLISKNIKVDRVLVFSDNQCNRSWGGKTVQASADMYRKAVNPDCWVHAIDLQGYGTAQFNGGKTNVMAGWSEKVLDFALLAEQGVGTLIKKIQASYTP